MCKSLQAIIQQFEPAASDVVLCIDNQAAIALASPTSNAGWRTRHLRIRAAYIHEQVETGQVKLRHTPGQYQLADLLTKGFPRQRLEELNGLWRIVDMTLQVTEVLKVAAAGSGFWARVFAD